jgi:hypothetical protein
MQALTEDLKASDCSALFPTHFQIKVRPGILGRFLTLGDRERGNSKEDGIKVRYRTA